MLFSVPSPAHLPELLQLSAASASSGLVAACAHPPRRMRVDSGNKETHSAERGSQVLQLLLLELSHSKKRGKYFLFCTEKDA